MFSKTITYKDYNDVERTETFYFDLKKSELAEMEMTTEGGFAAYLTKITESKNQAEIFRIFKMLLLKAYGEKSADGRKFVKSEALSEEFSQTMAYDELFMELGTNSEFASAFVKGILPKDLPTEG